MGYNLTNLDKTEQSMFFALSKKCWDGKQRDLSKLNKYEEGVLRKLMDKAGEYVPKKPKVKKTDTLEKANPYHDPKTGRFTTGPGGMGAVGHNGITTKEQDEAYMNAVKAGDMETASRMVFETAKEAGARTFANPDTPAYSIRRGPEPKETVKTYKTFFVDDEGNPSALFVEGTTPLPVGVWLDAKDAYHFQAGNGRMYTPSRKNPNSDGSGKTGSSIKIPNEEVRRELIERGFLPEGSTARDVTALAYRPGWHAGDLPFFPQGGKQGNPKLTEGGKENKKYDPNKPETNYAHIHRRNQVVFECEMAADINYTKTSSIKSGPHKGKVKYTDMQEMPSDGYYKFATNPMTNANELGTWYISGSLKIGRALTQEECDTMLKQKGFKPQEWDGGKLDLDKLNYNPNKTSRGSKLLDPVTYDDDGKVIPLSQRFDSSTDDVRKSEEETFSIYKTDSDKRLVFGWASIAITADGEQLEDRQKDMIDPEDLEEAVYDYVLNFRDTGEEHISTMRKKGKLVESCVFTAEKQRAMGIPEGTLPIGWWIGFKITDDDAWERVKNGTYKMFSIEGKANREPVEKTAPVAKTFDEIIEVDGGKFACAKGEYASAKTTRKSFDYIVEVEKFNPYHDKLGRFTTAGGSHSFTYSPGKSKAHDNAIRRERERIAAEDKKREAEEKKRQAEAKETKRDSFKGIAEGKRIDGKIEEVAANHKRAEVAQRLAEMQGYTGTPRVANRKEFDDAVKASGLVTYRTISDGTDVVTGKTKTASEFRDSFIHEDNIKMNGSGAKAFGAGIYMTANSNPKKGKSPTTDKINAAAEESASYGVKGKCTTMAMTLDKGAKIIDYDKAMSQMMREPMQMQTKYGRDIGAYAIAKGYDAMRIPTKNKDVDYIAVYNRTKVIVLNEPN